MKCNYNNTGCLTFQEGIQVLLHKIEGRAHVIKASALRPHTISYCCMQMACLADTCKMICHLKKMRHRFCRQSRDGSSQCGKTGLHAEKAPGTRCRLKCSSTEGWPWPWAQIGAACGCTRGEALVHPEPRTQLQAVACCKHNPDQHLNSGHISFSKNPGHCKRARTGTYASLTPGPWTLASSLLQPRS